MQPVKVKATAKYNVGVGVGTRVDVCKRYRHTKTF